MTTEVVRETINLTGYREIRYLSRAPSAAITGLEGFCSYLYSKGNPYVCSATPMNFIGAMIVELLKPDLTSIIEARGYDSGKLVTLKQPVKLIRNAEILYPNQTGSVTVPYLLHKADCGNYVGVVLGGDLAGLLVQTSQIESGGLASLVPFRVWNDSLLGPRDIYEPKFILDLALEIARQKPHGILEDRSNTKSEVLKLINDLLAEIKQTYKYTSQAFLGLCQDVLPMQVRKQMRYHDFHFTRSSGAI